MQRLREQIREDAETHRKTRRDRFPGLENVGTAKARSQPDACKRESAASGDVRRACSEDNDVSRACSGDGTMRGALTESRHSNWQEKKGLRRPTSAGRFPLRESQPVVDESRQVDASTNKGISARESEELEGIVTESGEARLDPAHMNDSVPSRGSGDIPCPSFEGAGGQVEVRKSVQSAWETVEDSESLDKQEAGGKAREAADVCPEKEPFVRGSEIEVTSSALQDAENHKDTVAVHPSSDPWLARTSIMSADQGNDPHGKAEKKSGLGDDRKNVPLSRSTENAIKINGRGEQVDGLDNGEKMGELQEGAASSGLGKLHKGEGKAKGGDNATEAAKLLEQAQSIARKR